MNYSKFFISIILLCCLIFSSCDTEKPNPIITPEETFVGNVADGIGYEYDEKTRTLTIMGIGKMGNGKYAPWMYTKPKTVIVSEGITTIGYYAFAYYIDEVTVDFTGFNVLECAQIPNSVTKIGECAFSNCMNLSKINIPNSVVKIGDDAFEYTGLKKIKFPKNLEKINIGVCFNCEKLEKVQFGPKVKLIDVCAFWSCSNLTTINLPDSLLELRSSAFEYCYNLSNIDIPQNVTYIGETTFKDCTSLTEMAFPESVEVIDKKAFFNCEKLKTVTINGKKTKLGKYSFGYKKADKEIVPIEGFTIKGYKGSTAEKYAEENGIKFIPLD